MIATVPSLLVGNPALPAQDLAALIALAKAKPDSYGMGGQGTPDPCSEIQISRRVGLFSVLWLQPGWPSGLVRLLHATSVEAQQAVLRA
jgi:tripartite-type tricarboxylate transporter receptor subunit TctC